MPEQYQRPIIVEIIWHDSLILNHGEWMDIDELREDLNSDSLLHHTVGYLVFENDSAVAIASSINAQPNSPTNRISGGMIIPRSAIKKQTTLSKQK